MSITKNTISAEIRSNNKKIGELVKKHGEWAFLPDPNHGVWTAHMLRKIADIIDKSNEDKV